MGGKPWTSKGCVNCRRRKVKCDEQRPECGRCLKSGIKCQGWEQYRNFIGAASISEARKQKTQTKLDSNGGPGSRLPMGAIISAPQYPRRPNMPIAVRSAQAMRAQIFESFIQNFSAGFLLHSATFDDSLICSIASLAQKSQMTDRALSAISCLFLGKVDHNASIFNHGVYLYNSAIRHMSNTIRRGTCTKDIFYTVFLFQEIDIIHSPNGLGNYGVHIAGMTTLLQHYGSQLSGDPIIHTIHRHRQKLRTVFASSGMCLSQSERDLLMEPANGDPLLEILQTTVAIGDLKSLIDSTNPSNLDPDSKVYQTILRRCYEIQDILVGMWQDGRLGNDPHRLQLRVSTGNSDSCDAEVLSPENLFGFAYDFSNPDHAFLFIMFWTHLLLLQPLIRRATYLLRLHTGSTTGIRPARQFEDLEFVDPEKYGDKIARTVPYCLQDCMKQTFTKGAAFASCMAVVMYVHTGNRAKVDWCKEAIGMIGSRGSDIASKLIAVEDALWERRWTVGDPTMYTSLRSCVSVFDMKTAPVLEGESELEDGSIYHGDSTLAIREITNDN